MVNRAIRIGTSVGTRSTAQVSRAAGVPPYWAFGSHGPWVSMVATTASVSVGNEHGLHPAFLLCRVDTSPHRAAEALAGHCAQPAEAQSATRQTAR